MIKGHFPTGSLISEGMVCEQFSLSRTPVHEAFLRLAAENWLQLLSRKGAVVRPMAPRESEDVLEMREAIESSAAERVIREERTAELLPLLSDLLETQAAAIEGDDVDGFIVADDAFHSAVVEASGNRIAVDFMARLRDRQQRLRHQLIRIRPSQLELALREHRQLVAALSRGDATRYASVLHQHVFSHRGVL
ncbi:GntR family transcriptional regulator [Mycobacterium sherrisii]|uniref:GntR family transcriptional regulator n=1 Tax=Mycobacterium sherrisii TaxID=243061 RepID=UPI0039759597